MPTIDSLTPEQEARFDEWADRWIEIGLRTGPADRERFEAACERCYAYAGLPWHQNVVWTTSPLTVAYAGPIAAHLLNKHGAVGGAVREAVREAVGGAVHEAVREAVHGAVGEAVDEAVHEAVHGAVGEAVREAVHEAVGGAVSGAVDEAVREAVGGAVHEAVREAVHGAVSGAVDEAVHEAVGGAVSGAVDEAVREAVGGAVSGAVHGAVGEAVRRAWHRYLGGQLWAGGWYWGGAWTSYFREVCQLELPGDLWNRARAHEDTIESACWWWPHREFVIVSERPAAIHRELVDPNRPRGWGSHRLHCEDGPAVAFNGWAIWAWHGVRVPQAVIEAPHTLDPAAIVAERNVEVRRVMIERFGQERLLTSLNAERVSMDDYGELYRLPLDGDEPIVMVRLTCPSTGRVYFERVPPDMERPRQALAWQAQVSEAEYVLAAES